MICSRSGGNRMKLLGIVAAFALAFAGQVRAAPTAADQAAITAIETRLCPPQIAGAEPLPCKTLAVRLADLKVPGVSIAVLEGGRIKWARAYGVATAGEAQPVTPSTLFQAASMSKAFA